MKKVKNIIPYILVALFLLSACNSITTPKETKTIKDPSTDIRVVVEEKKETPTLELVNGVDGIEIEKDYFGDWTFKGLIKNNTDKEFNYVEITFNLYDKDGNLLGQAFDNVNNLKPNTNWKFEAYSWISNCDEIASYELASIESF